MAAARSRAIVAWQRARNLQPTTAGLKLTMAFNGKGTEGIFPGDTLTTTVWELGERRYGFVAAGSDGAPVIKDGRAELR